MNARACHELLRAALHVLQEQTGFKPFDSGTGIDGLAKTHGTTLEILAIHASRPGTGQCRRFIAEMKQRYDAIAVWSIWNDDLRAALKRYGFKPARKQEPDGEILVGLKWTKSAP